MNLTYRSFCKYCGEKVFIATIRSKSQIATLEGPFLVLLGEEPEKVANEQLFHLFYVGLVFLEHLEKVRPFNHLLHFFFEFDRFDSWYKVAHRRRKGSNPCVTKNDAIEDLYFGVKRDTAKPEKWHNARHRTPRVDKKRLHPARMHRHRRRTRHGLPGQRNVPLHGESRHKGGPAVVLQGGLRQGI